MMKQGKYSRFVIFASCGAYLLGVTVLMAYACWLYGVVAPLAVLFVSESFLHAKNGRYPPTQNGDIRSLF